MAQVMPLPGGAHEWTDQTGVLDLDGFVHGFFTSNAWSEETSLSKERGFVTAARRGWRATDGSQSFVFLVQFANAAGAQSLYDSISEGWKQNPDQGTVFTDPADQATGLSVTKLDKYGNAYAKVMAVQGNTLIRTLYFTAANPDKAGAQDLLHRQLAAMSNPAAQVGA
ncbi:hypothetical protein [Kitasatospora acidiphila]|uniref:hypothetical protein n=1 Tax=Kitasatospora acidiphila TaxID=2567942 RepID=UPI003C790A79